MNLVTGKMKIAIVAVFCCVAVFFVVGGALAWTQGYDGRIGPRTHVGTIDVSGMDPETARQLVQGRIDELYATGAAVTLDGKDARVPLSALIGSDGMEVVHFDLDATIREASVANHDANGFWDAIGLLEAAVRPTRIRANVTGSERTIASAVRDAFPTRERLAKDAAFSFSFASGTWSAEVVPGVSGEEFDITSFRTALLERLAELGDAPVLLSVVLREPSVTDEVALSEAKTAASALTRAPFALSLPSDSATGLDRTWKLTATDLAKLVVPGQNGLSLDSVAFDAFIQPISEEVEIPAQNARFERKDGRIVEFATSAMGRSLNREQAFENLVSALNAQANDASNPPASVILALEDVEPLVKTSEADDLGITDVLGTGTSSFKGSPRNRIANIRNGVNLLNGLLIAPDETFSLLEALKPFELSNGYLPELVIKGDKIIPEIAGGLCQIGTTTFRAVMNSGLDVVARSNHSLVVSYYNDPSNNNPGTDATIYDPAPDFKFKNDTGRYVLFEASMDETAQSLSFTLWGTSDGRLGSYVPPTVLRWIGVGEPIMTETTELPVGEKKCQAAHVGADTTFTYTVVRPDGTVADRVFDSHYRPLPQICLVGVEQLSTPEDLQPATDSVSSLITTDAPVIN